MPSVINGLRCLQGNMGICRFNGAMAQGRNGAKAQGHNGTKAQRHNGTKVKLDKENLVQTGCKDGMYAVSKKSTNGK